MERILLSNRSCMCRETANDNVPTSTTIEQIDNIIDNYANIVSDNDDEDFVATQNDIDNNFVFPTPKRNHRQTLIPIVIVAVKTVNGVKLPRPLLKNWAVKNRVCPGTS